MRGVKGQEEGPLEGTRHPHTLKNPYKYPVYRLIEPLNHPKGVPVRVSPLVP